MPELAEVERAKNACKLATEGKIISSIVTREDTIVYSGTTHEEFAKHVKGQKVLRVGRLGKMFYMVLQTAPHILMHLGMAGFVSTRGQEPLFYRKKAKNWKNDDGSEWPLRYWKFALKMDDGSEWCFCDSRRLGRIKLVGEQEKDITEAEPLSLLGRDPYLDMPSLDELSSAVLRRKAPIKAVLLNQNGPLCGIGNWLVDEILYQAKIHPAERSNTLNTLQLLALHTKIQEVVNTAVAVNADHARFPSHWLFKYRWGKGRRNEPATFELPDGTMAIVTHQTVGGRTSAIVESVQKLVGPVEGGSDAEDEPGTGTEAGDTDGLTPMKKVKTPKKKKATKKRKAKKEDPDEESDLTPIEDDERSEPEKNAVKQTPKSRKKSVKAEKVEDDLEQVKEEVADVDAVTPEKTRTPRKKAVKTEE